MFGMSQTLSVVDVVLLALGLGIGTYTFLYPKKAWHTFQSKKLKSQMKEPDEKVLKTTKYFGGFIALLALISIIVEFIGK